MRHARLGQLSGHLLQPYTDGRATKPSQTLSDVIFEHDSLNAALDSLAEEKCFNLGRDEQVVVRKVVIEFNKWVPVDTGPAEVAATASGRDSSAAKFDTAALRLHDFRHLLDTLAGKTEPSDEERKQWGVLLTLLKDKAVGRMRSAAYCDYEHERA